MIDLSITKVLRPYAGFEYDYDRLAVPNPAQKLPGSTPIAFSYARNPHAVNFLAGQYDPYAFDDQAREGIVGYSPRLCAMTSVPIGSNVLILFPAIQGTADFCYAWRILWRMRNMGDFKRKGLPFSVGKEALGVADTTAVIGGPRVVIPSISENSGYVRNEPYSNASIVGDQVFAAVYSYPEMVVIPANFVMGGVGDYTNLGSPIIPGGDPITGQYVETQQGLIDPNLMRGGQLPSFIPVWTKASGNELGIFCYKFNYRDPASATPFVARDWDFQLDQATGFVAAGAEDLNFSQLMGVGRAAGGGPYPDMGVYILHGEI